MPEVHGGNQQQFLVTTGIRSRVRHPIYLGHLCEMLAWSVGTGLAVCWLLTAFAIYRCGDDSHGGHGVGEKVRGGVFKISAKCRSCGSEA